ncbi:sugar ABC transporter ATP-binding protein [Plastorhodobacter daqingensis]|uniref:Sugar ABC transporter ATP-binding protein n=1 Tax=Plastorhodobacter daqingensis TaxID=1387281 RepID=A0ABW2UH45_9RHOB
MTEALLQLDSITKEWFGVPAVRDLTLTVPRGQVLGLIGENGAGKSTLMNMIGGVVPPSRGTMHLKGAPYAPAGPIDATRAGIAFIHQELNLFTNLSILDNIFITGFPRRFGLTDRRTASRETKALLDRLEIRHAPETLVEELAPGERQLIEIAKALHRSADLIIFDEPTTSLTPRETARLFEVIAQLRNEGRTVIYISHILSDVRMLCDRIAVLRDGQLVDEGAATDFGISRMIRSMIGRDLASLFPPRSAPPGEDVLVVAQGISQPGVVEDITFSIRAGEMLGLFGLMGSGRSEVARIFFGLDPAAEGTLTVAGRVARGGPVARIADGIAFVTENRREEGLLMEAPVAENISLATLGRLGRGPFGFLDRETERATAERARADLSIRVSDLERLPVRALSGGNQQKVVIAKWLAAAPRLFILDEPTRGVDVGAKYEIYALADRLAAAGNAVLFISSELEELTGMCDRILVMNRGEITADFLRAGQTAAFDREALLAAAFREVVA